MRTNPKKPNTISLLFVAAAHWQNGQERFFSHPNRTVNKIYNTLIGDKSYYVGRGGIHDKMLNRKKL